MDRRLLPLNALRVFEVVARTANLTAAADELSITQSAVSRHIRKLEDLIGQRLFTRTARGVALNQAGHALGPVAARAFDALADVLNDLSTVQHLTIHFPPALLHTSAMEVLRDFRVQFPTSSVEVVSSKGVGQPAAPTDISVIFDRDDMANDASELIRAIRFIPICSAATAPPPGVPIATFLADAELLHVRIGHRPSDFLWSEYARALGIAPRSMGGMTFETLATAVDYARATQSVVLADLDLVGPDLEGGTLVAPYPDAAADLGFGYYLKVDPKTNSTLAITRMKHWLIERLRSPGN